MIKLLIAAVVVYALWTVFRPRAPLIRDEADARAILGVGRDADAEAIRAAHRRRVAGVHPDRGGSAELARRVNAARDLLLKRRAG
jgi:DnaJ homolog subfamily C member 19